LIELKITIEDIDYESVADFLTPAFEDQYQNGNIPGWARLLLVAGGSTAETIKKIVARVPDEKKEEMIVQVVNYKTERTARKLEEMAADRGIRIRIMDVGARKIETGE